MQIDKKLSDFGTERRLYVDEKPFCTKNNTRSPVKNSKTARRNDTKEEKKGRKKVVMANC